MIEIIIMTIVWGVLIGILVSAPMGPTGILVIQRTLNKGWLPGFLTGIGAVISDLFYAILTTFFIGLVVDWIQNYQITLQVCGSIFIAGYGYYLWHSNPAASLNTNDQIVWRGGKRVRGILKYLFSGFGLTISNPMIVFFFLALFARTNFLFDASTERWWLYLMGFTCIIGGAIAWWLLITWIINKVRNHFKLRTLRNINRAIATLMFVIASYGLAHGIYLWLILHQYIGS